MPRENIEVVQRAWDARFRGDLAGLFRECDPEVVWDTRH